MTISDYTPHVIETQGHTSYVEVLLALTHCGICDRPMFPLEFFFGSKKMPRNWQLDSDAQARRAGWPSVSNLKNKNNDPICSDCAASDKSSFICALCKTERPSSRIEESFGDPSFVPSHLCTTCYETASAKQWDAKTSQLREAHRWDYE